MIKNICLSLAASIALIAGVAQAATDNFLRIVGISGTSNVLGFEDYIEIESWSLGFTQGNCQGLHFTKQMDTASAELTAAALLGTLYPTAILVARKPGERPFTFLKLTLANTIVTSFQIGASSGGGPLPFEQVTLQPSSVKFEAFTQDAAGNAVLAATSTVTCQKAK